MHQTFYIDIDEEITSIVDRLKKAKAKEVVLVVPKRALLIQSIVNLKLLKKEAERLGMQIMIVTQDKLGKLLIEKAGILVQSKLDETLEEEVIEADEDIEKEDEIKKNEIEEDEETKKRVKNIGSEEYFCLENKKKDNPKETGEKVSRKKDEIEKITNKELVTHVGKNLRKKSFFKGKKGKMIDLVNVSNFEIKDEKDVSEKKKRVNASKKNLSKNGKNVQKLANFFQSKKGIEKNEVKKSKHRPIEKKQEIHINGKFWKSFFFFSSLVVVAFILLGAYLFLPKVEIKIFPKIKTESEDFQINGYFDLGEINLVEGKIPIKKVEVDEQYSQDFSSTGEEGISNQKARGIITVYNEYSSSPQPLVATTRFLTEDGKLFRLVSGITVPGMKKESGEMKPGEIEAQVIADEAGSEYNIEKARFSIPGFKSSGEEKHSKFYAILENGMKGGGDGNEKVKTVTKDDIERAKAKILASFDEKNKKVLEESVGQGWVILDETIVNENIEYISSNSPGEVADKFSLIMKIKRKAFAFLENDAKEMVSEKVSKNNNGYEIDNKNIVLDFGKADADWEKDEMVIRFRANVDMGASLDLENIKKGILGKTEDELKKFLSSYSEIEKVEVDYWPFFVNGKIPMYEKRVQVTLDKD